ncbi:1,4-beta-xylanase like protein [Zymoseptoria brevis]|uniref:Endo-1,5-alpha-L-arabinanase A n=1 Tax=Zymoseptoria brevis TaxID=1047168 RepID=A0A0F4GJZ2_9PEZI|nr:1,4-beta-xylanase like protein [Zymoseptoria brevis]
MRTSFASVLAGLTALAASVKGSPLAQPEAELDTRATAYEGYMMAYFTGNSRDGEKIYFAASNGNDALSWTELNGGKPALTSTEGTTGVRDPFIMRSQDGSRFYLLATDLSIGSGTSFGDAQRHGSQYLEIWESTDLVNWGTQRHVKVSTSNAGNTWAPEAQWDSSINKYVVYWASTIYADSDPNHTANTYQKMMYATTSDFYTFSAPQVWQDVGTSRIDTTVLLSNGVYHRFTKDEGAGTTGCSDIIQERSTRLLNQVSGYTQVTSCIGKKAGTSAVEGPTVFKSNPNDVNGNKFYLWVDEYGGRGYIPLETADIADPSWEVSASYKLPTSPRHGTVLPITAAELARIRGNDISASEAGHGSSITSRGANAEEHNTNGAAKSASNLIPGLYADPNICVFNKNYYIYATSDGYAGWGGQEFYVWKSSNLVSWTRSEKPFLTLNGTSGNVPWADGNAWAPTAISRNGKYYFYFSGNNPTYNRKTIGAAVASSPEGPFTAQANAMILNDESVTSGQAIDPAAFYDPNTGTYYLYWGNGNPVMAELGDDMVSIKANTLRAISGLTDFREGSFMVYRKPYYHMTYSIDDTGSENYRVGYATAPSATGPFTYRGVVLEKDVSQGILATGHDSIINVPGTDRWYMAYHRFGRPNGDGQHRETTIDKVTFASNGLMNKVVPTVDGVVTADTVP